MSNAVARAEDAVRLCVQQLAPRLKQELERRVNWMFEARSTITIRELKTLLRTLGCELSEQDSMGLFKKYAGNGKGVVECYPVMRLLFGDKPAHSLTAQMCRLPGIKTPHRRSNSTNPASSGPGNFAGQANAHQATNACKQAVCTWARTNHHSSVWAAYQAFKSLAPGAIPGNEMFSENMFLGSIYSIDPTIEPQVAATAFKHCDLNRDGSLDVNEFKALLPPKLDDRLPIWVTRKEIRLADPNPPKTMLRTVPSGSKGKQTSRNGWPWLSPCLSNLYDPCSHKPKQKTKPPPPASCLFNRGRPTLDRPGSKGDQLASFAAEFAHEWYWREQNAQRRNTLALLGMGIKGDYRDYMVAKYGLER